MNSATAGASASGPEPSVPQAGRAAPPGDGAATLHRELTGEILGAFFTVHGELGFGFSEGVYLRALALELFIRGVAVLREVPLSVHYKGVTVGTFRAHLIVDDKVVVHITAGERVNDADRYVVLNHLRCAGREVGLLLHFGTAAIARRVVATASSVAIEGSAAASDAHVQ
ncbi:MAG TPA: GxxExxY protein [Gemmatimonadaceae bacterium]|nr:GxxExxY protein [Gemmatimonadaceae bacterium]